MSKKTSSNLSLDRFKRANGKEAPDTVYLNKSVDWKIIY